MKKLRIKLQPGSTGKKITLFPSSEALYVWLCSLERGETITVPDIEELVLLPDGFIEVELIGFEYAYEGSTFKRFNLIRLGLAQKPQNSSGLRVTVHSGWVSDGFFPLRAQENATTVSELIDAENSSIDVTSMLDDDDYQQEK